MASECGLRDGWDSLTAPTIIAPVFAPVSHCIAALTMTTLSEKNNLTHASEMSGVDPGVEELELAIVDAVEKTHATYLYKGTVASRHDRLTK